MFGTSYIQSSLSYLHRKQQQGWYWCSGGSSWCMICNKNWSLQGSWLPRSRLSILIPYQRPRHIHSFLHICSSSLGLFHWIIMLTFHTIDICQLYLVGLRFDRLSSRWYAISYMFLITALLRGMTKVVGLLNWKNELCSGQDWISSQICSPSLWAGPNWRISCAWDARLASLLMSTWVTVFT